MRILLLGPLPPPFGGPEVMTEALLDGLGKRDEVVVKHINTQVSRSLAEKGGRHQFRKSFSAARQTVSLISCLFLFRPHIIYLPLTNSPSFLGFVRDCGFMIPTLLFGKRLAVRLHGGFYSYAHTQGLQRAFVRSVLSRVSLAMVQGQRLITAFDGLVPLDRICVIPNGLDGGPFAAARIRQCVRSTSLKRVLFVGLMCREKGFRDVIAAVPSVPGAEFVFAGEWPSALEEKETRAFLRSNGIEGRVTFAGVVSGPAKYDLFASSDAFVFPTYFAYEGHAVSVVEALATGLAIVCTDHGALNESVRDGWNGFFVHAADPSALAARLNLLVRDDKLRRTMGEHSRELYEERFTLQRFTDNWTQAIRRCGEQ